MHNSQLYKSNERTACTGVNTAMPRTGIAGCTYRVITAAPLTAAQQEAKTAAEARRKAADAARIGR
jgi:hypothetical protein